MEAQPAAPDGAGEMKGEDDGPLAEQKLPHDGDDVPPLRGLGDLVRSPPLPPLPHEIQKYRNTFAIKLLHKAYNQHQGAHPTPAHAQCRTAHCTENAALTVVPSMRVTISSFRTATSNSRFTLRPRCTTVRFCE